MSHKSPKIAALIADLQGRDLPAHYLGYFACFNRGQFYEAHDVLEELWLADRHGPNGNFYKGLIQFAGAFVHLQKDCLKYPRLRPAAALFKLAAANLRQFPARHERLDLAVVQSVIADWLGRLETEGFAKNPLTNGPAPQLILADLGPRSISAAHTSIT
ncbi:MAG: DUF309 domain-containing protein [Verrucomicrobia bacterium]|nr:DUF309 domain-containing protein [Verrucomicrobiota bacterium]